MGDSKHECYGDENEITPGNVTQTPSKQLCDGVSAMCIEDHQHSQCSSISSKRGSATKRRRQTSLSSPCRKRADTRRRSRSLQLDTSNDTLVEKKPSQKKFVSMAEAMYNFEKNTPERFHTRPIIDGAHRAKGGLENPPLMRLRCTIPQSPKFFSHLRARPVTYPSKEEREEAELQQMQKFIFKAAPLKAEILKEPQPLRKVEPRPATKPSPFHLTEVRKLQGNTEKDGNVLKTQRIKKNIFPDEKQPMRCAEGKAVVTVLEKRDNAACIVNKEMEQPGVKKPTPSKRVTKPEPFTFEERDKIRNQQKEEKIRQILEEEKKAREFHAKPIPKAVKCSVSQPEIKVHSPTQPQPFHLRTEERMLLHEEANKAKLEEERRAAEAIQFKAKPPVVLQKRPFEPVRPHRVLQEITDICLNTEIRSKEREKFERKMKEKELLMEEYRRKLQEAQERAEEEERAKLRKQAVHKAQPIPKYAPIVITKSSKDLTTPESPFSRTKQFSSSDSSCFEA